jgi:lysophospholipase L1-like esterase
MSHGPRCLFATAAIAAAIALSPFAAARDTTAKSADGAWVTTWTTALLKPTFVFSNPGNYGFKNQTLRITALTSAGGQSVRVRLTNRFGTTPLIIGKASIAPRHKPFNADLVEQGVHGLTFGGKPSITIAPGAVAVSDPVAMDVLPSQVVAVDLYLPEATGPIPFNFATATTSYIADGDRAGDPTSRYFKPQTSWYILDGIEVANPASAGTIVACCDSVSITGQVDAGMRWPEILSRFLHERWGNAAPSVVQTTLSGQRLLTSSHYAESALSRFKRDVLSETNLRAVILFVGVNDLGVPQMPPIDIYSPTNDVSADEMIAGYKKLVAMARSRGVPIFGATITPGSGYVHQGHPYWSAAQEVKRRKINTWLRSTDIFDKVFDFAAAVQNPLDEEYYRPGASFDNIHPSDSGQYLIARSIDADLLMRAATDSKK